MAKIVKDKLSHLLRWKDHEKFLKLSSGPDKIWAGQQTVDLTLLTHLELRAKPINQSPHLWMMSVQMVNYGMV